MSELFSQSRPSILFVTPPDRVSSCIRGFATLCKPVHTSPAIAGVRRLVSFEKTELTELGSEFVPGFQGPLALCKQDFMLCAHRCLYGGLVAHFVSPFIH